MDKLACSLKQMKPAAKFKTKPNRKPQPIHSSPIKVVYISNPIRVKVTASEFRALVQELTGQDSELPDPAKFSSEGVPTGPHDNDPPRAKEGSGLDDDIDDPVQEVPAMVPQLCDRLVGGGALAPFEEFDEDSDEVFMPQMLENLAQLCPWALLYGS